MINNLAFNQIVSHFTVTTNYGFIVFSLTPTPKAKIIETSTETTKYGMNILKILNKSNAYVFNGLATPELSFSLNNLTTSRNTLLLWDQGDKKPALRIDCAEPIRNLLIHQNEYIVVVLINKLLIFSFSGKLLNTIKTYTNPNGLCEISNMHSGNFIVSLGNFKGEILIWNFEAPTESEKTLQAHDNNLESIAISKDGLLIATSSEIGTIIRIFNTVSGNKLYEFRRGSNPSKITSISFSHDSKYLACCSSKGNTTIHIFDLENEKNTQSRLSTFKDYLPTWFGDSWSFKQYYIPDSNTICAFDDKDILHVLSYDDNYYRICGMNYDIITETKLDIEKKMKSGL